MPKLIDYQVILKNEYCDFKKKIRILRETVFLFE